MASAFVEVGRIALDEETLVLLKPVVQFSLTYGVSRGFLYICLYFKHQFIAENIDTLTKGCYNLQAFKRMRNLVYNQKSSSLGNLY